MDTSQREHAVQLGLTVFYNSKSFTEATNEYAAAYDISSDEAKYVVRGEYYNACRGKARLTSQTGILESPRRKWRP